MTENTTPKEMLDEAWSKWYCQMNVYAASIEDRNDKTKAFLDETAAAINFAFGAMTDADKAKAIHMARLLLVGIDGVSKLMQRDSQ